MEKFAFLEGAWVESSLDTEECVWIDASRDEAELKDSVLAETGLRMHDNHLKDSLNKTHPPKYENCGEYELLILLIDVSSDAQRVEWEQFTFLFTQTTLLTIRPHDCAVWMSVRAKFCNKKHKAPNSIASLITGIFSVLVNEQLNQRGVLSLQLEEFQQKLLQTSSQEGPEWDEFFTLQKRLKSLESLADSQLDALALWRAETDFVLTENDRVRINDVVEHLDRYAVHIDALSADIRNMLQIYFSITQEKTNNTMRILTVISVIFLPLNLVAGIFGMNFSKIPGLESHYAFWVVLLLMLVAASLGYWVLHKLR